MNDYSAFYNSLIKPFFAPPDYVFTIAWGIIYPLIAVSVIYIAYLIYKDKISTKAITLFVINMVANVLFTPIQFGLQNNILATLDILVVTATVVFFELNVWKQSKILFFLMLPYTIWVIFATFLQINITWLNL